MPYYYRRRPLSGETYGNPIDASADLARGAVALTRPLLPLPGAGAEPLVSGLSGEDLTDEPALAKALGDGADAVMRSPGARVPARAKAWSSTGAIEDVAGAALPALGAVGDAAGATAPMATGRSITDQAGALLPRAAGILDEEMARGAFAAQGATAGFVPEVPGAPTGLAPAPQRSATGSMPATGGAQIFPAALPVARLQEAASFLGQPALSSPMNGIPAASGGGDLVRDLNGFVERFAGLLSHPGGNAAPSAGTATLASRAPVRPGGTTTIDFDLHNEESRAQVLRPIATALISEGGAQMPAECVRCEPTEITLASGERHSLRLSIQVPTGASPGCYTGLLVLTGGAQLHSLIQVSVATA